MSGSSKNGPRGTADRRQSKARSASRKAAGKGRDTGDVSRALRTVYDSTLREEVPRDFLDLLGKLD